MKKVVFFVPAIFGLVFYSLLAFFSGFGAIHPVAWLCVAMLFVSAVLMGENKWLGCIPGGVVGILLIWMSFQYNGQIIEIERPLGIAILVFYCICGLHVYAKQRT